MPFKNCIRAVRQPLLAIRLVRSTADKILETGYFRYMNLAWYLKEWNELNTDELYEILALRINVFVIEQNCPYQDADGKDKKSLHLFAMDEFGKCKACLRLVKPGISYEEWAIGRVVTDQSVRRQNVGRALMGKAIEFFEEKNNPAIRISAQSHLQKFYQEFGFESVSEEYMEDDIPHVEMLRVIKSS